MANVETQKPVAQPQPQPPLPPKPRPAAAKPMPRPPEDAGGQVTHWRRVRAVFLRVVSLCFLAYGLINWSYVVGVSNYGDAPFSELRAPVRNMMSLYAALDLVSAVGLWLASAWGVVIWFFDSILRMMLHTVYADVHGSNVPLTIVEGVLMAAYAVVAVLARREEKREEKLLRLRRRQTLQNMV
jgi:hypothetical protein